MAKAIVAAVTNLGRKNISLSALYGYSYQLKYYVVGSLGHDPVHPGIALTPDLSLEELPGQFYGPKELTDKRIVGVYCPRLFIRLDKSDAVGDISSFGIIGEWIDPPGGIESGDSFLFAIANTGFRSKTDREILELDVDILY